MNIEDIKKRHATEIMFLPIVEGYNQSRNDVEYLLSIVEQAEKALRLVDKAFKLDYIEDIEVIKHMIEDSGITSGTAMSIYLQQAEEMEFRNKVRKTAKEALKSIKGEG